MERKIVSGIMLTLLLMGVLSMAIHVVAVFAEDPIEVGADHPAQAIWVEPDFFDTLEYCDSFTVSVWVNITDPPGAATGLYGWEYILHWNATELSLTSHVEPDLTDPAGLNWANGFWVKKNVSPAPGYFANESVWCAATAMSPDPAFTGVTWLSNYTFHVEHQAALAYVGHILMDLEGLTDDQVGDLVPPFTDKEVVEFRIMGLLSVCIYTDKYSYSKGDTMYLGLNVTNLLGRAIKVCVAIWLEKPFVLILHAHAVKLPSGLTYSNPNFESFVLPRIPSGVYTWHAALLIPATHKIITEDTAQWQFS